MMPDEEKTLESPLGLTPQEVARYMRKKLFEVLQVKPEFTWEQLTPDKRTQWVHNTEVLFLRTVNTQALSASQTTREFVDKIKGQGTYDNYDIPWKVLWEAVVRHGLNLMTAGGASEDGWQPTRDEAQRELHHELEYNWSTWIANEIQKRQA